MPSACLRRRPLLRSPFANPKIPINISSTLVTNVGDNNLITFQAPVLQELLIKFRGRCTDRGHRSQTVWTDGIYNNHFGNLGTVQHENKQLQFGADEYATLISPKF